MVDLVTDALAAYTARMEANKARFELHTAIDRWEDEQHRHAAAGRTLLGSAQDNPDVRRLTTLAAEREREQLAAEHQAGGRVFRIAVDNAPELERKIAKLTRRAAKIDAPAPTLTLTGHREPAILRDIDGRKVHVTFTYVVLANPIVKVEGYEFVATIQHTDEGNIIRTVPGRDGDFTARDFYDAAPWCDHCKTARRRNDTFLVLGEDGLRQIGRNCLADFLGHNAENAARAAGWLALAADECEQYEDEDDEVIKRSGRGEPLYDIETYLTHVCACIREHGYTSGSRAREYGGEPTKDDALRNLDRSARKERDKWDAPMWVEPTDEDAQRAAATLAWARETYTLAAIDAAPDREADFLNNMRVAFAQTDIPARLSGYVAYGPQAHAKATEQQIREEQAAAAIQKGYLGEVGERITITATLTRIIEISDNYSYNGGTKPLYVFVTTDGQDVKWFSSRDVEIETGETYTLTGRVKSHDDGKVYGEQRYHPATVLTRCKILSEATR